MAPLKHREGPLPGGVRLGKRSHFNWWPEEPSGTPLKPLRGGLQPRGTPTTKASDGGCGSSTIVLLT